MADKEGGRILLILGLAALALAAGLWHGLPNVYIPDTHIIRNALGMAKSRDLWPPAGMYSTYPYFLAYLLLPVYGITYFAGRLLGCYASAEDFGRSVVENPTVVYMEARIMVALFGVAAVYFLYRTARRLNLSRTTAAGAALLLAFNPLFVQFGHQARPWVPLVAGIVFTLYHSINLAVSPRRRDVLLASAGAGITFAMHQVGGAALLIPLAAYLAGRGRAAFQWRSLRTLAAILALFATLAFFLGYGHKVFGGQAKAVIETGETALDIGGQKLVLGMFTGALAGKMARALFGYDPLGVTVGLMGLLYGLFFSNAFRGLRSALAVFCGFVLAFFLLYEGAHIRYFLPVMPALALGAALGAGRVGKVLGLREGWLLLPLLCFSGLQTARLDALLCRTDTRDLARVWIEERIPGGARIAAEGYTPVLRPDRASLFFLRDEAKVWLKRREELILSGGGTYTGRDYFLIPLQRFYEFKSYWPHQYLLGGERPIDVFLDDMRAEWIVLSDQWPREERHPPLMEYLARRGTLEMIFNPGGEGRPLEADLPLEMDFALAALWTLDRAGPMISVFKINR